MSAKMSGNFRGLIAGLALSVSACKSGYRSEPVPNLAPALEKLETRLVYGAERVRYWSSVRLMPEREAHRVWLTAFARDRRVYHDHPTRKQFLAALQSNHKNSIWRVRQ